MDVLRKHQACGEEIRLRPGSLTCDAHPILHVPKLAVHTVDSISNDGDLSVIVAGLGLGESFSQLGEHIQLLDVPLPLREIIQLHPAKRLR